MKVKINKKLLPLKFHFFIFWASYSSAIPFMMVVARQLGIPVGVQGTVSAAIITAAVLAKPVIAAAADILPSFRKGIFLALLTIMVMTVGPIGFLPPMYSAPEFTGRVFQGHLSDALTKDNYLLSDRKGMEGSGSCIATVGWDCMMSCQDYSTCPSGNTSIAVQKMTLQTLAGSVDFNDSSILDIRYLSSTNDFGEIYKLEGISTEPIDTNYNVSVLCSGGERTGDGCVSCWHTLEFWIYVILLLAGQVSATTAESISDAICLDTIGENGDYGSQRAWGALSYGIFGTISGLLVDWHSGDHFMKDYTPAFLLLVVFGTLDVLLSAAYLKVPKFEGGNAMWVNLRPLLIQPRFFVFLFFAFLVGFYDGVDTGYVFILQEDMAAGTSMMKHMKLLQGLTMLVQALSAAPFMFVYDWFMKKMGSEKVISLVLGLYTIRLVGLSLAGYAKLVWATIAIEVINGPCFGLGYTAVIVHASSITPPGTSATVQSVVNICYGTFGYAGASLIGGILYETVGGLWLYGITGILAAVTCVLHIISLRFLSPTPENASDSRTEEKENGGKEAISNHNNSVVSSNGQDKPKSRKTTEGEMVGTEEERSNLLQHLGSDRRDIELKEVSASQ